MPVPALTPAEVYLRADVAWHAQKLPPYLSFVTRIYREKDAVRVLVRTEDGAVYTETLPSEPVTQVVHAAGGLSYTKTVSPPPEKIEAVVDPLLVGPYGAPLGFCVSTVRCSGLLSTDPFGPAAPPRPTSEKTIATVRSYANAYAIAFGPTANFQRHGVYELVLTPRFDPKRFELRDMLVDASDFRIWQMTYSVPRASGRDATIRYRFGPVGDFWYLLDVCDWDPDAGICGPRSTDLDQFATYASAPPWLFDESLWKRHQAASNPTPMP